MKVPGVQFLVQKLSVFRHNKSLLIAIIIGLVAIVLFIPIQLISSRLKGQIAVESVAQGKTIQTDIAHDLSSEQWKEEEKYQQSYANDANQIELLVKESSQRPLLSYRIFPGPKDTSALIFEEFSQRFRGGIEQLIAQMNSSDRPTEAELERGLQSSSVRSRLRGRMSSLRSPSLYPRNIRGSVRIASDVDATIVDEICQEKAKSASVYANPTDISGYEFWSEYQHPGRDEALKDCWYWQLGYWVIEDVADTIIACNTGSKSVFTSPVKRLLRVGFNLSERRTMRYRSFIGPRTGRKSSDDKPSYIISVQDGLTMPCTARFCNNDLDIIHFNVVVLVSADAVLPFMQKLCSAKEHKFTGWDGQLNPPATYEHNQITILESNIKPVERQLPEHEFYRYGDNAVVELDLICEYIFNKSGYDVIKPDAIKEELKVEEKKT